jgi:hypothetical protein
MHWTGYPCVETVPSAAKKSWLRIASKPAPVDFISYVNLVPIVVMMTVVAVIAVSVGPIV